MPDQPVTDLSARAIHAAVDLARELGLAVTRPTILWERSNLIVHLRPAPVIARIATATRLLRDGDEWLAREVAVAGFLAARGAPVVAPTRLVPPGPHTHAGFTITLWEYAQVVAEPLDAFEAGRRLRVCHEALAGFRGELPRMAPVTEAGSIVERLASTAPEAATRLRAAGADVRDRLAGLSGPLQAVHGDAGFSNVLTTAAGPVWNDWEDTFEGPPAWDLACLEAGLPPFGDRDPALVAAARAGYGEPASEQGALAAMVAARRYQVTVWGVALALQAGDRELVEGRLDRLARVMSNR